MLTVLLDGSAFIGFAGLVIGTLIAWWGGKIADGKGYNFWLGFVLCWFFSLIGLLITALLPDRY